MNNDQPISTHDHIVIVSADSHMGPRAREDLRQYCPKDRLDQYDAWLEHIFAQGKEGNYDRRHSGNPDRLRRTQLNATAGHHDIHARLADMDRDGVTAAVIFHGSQNAEPLPFLDAVGTRIFRTGGADEFELAREELDLVKTGLQMYNNWLADACSVQPERNIGLAHLPTWDIGACTEELIRTQKLGLKGVNFPAPRAGIKYFDDPEWDPFFTACEELGMALTTHAGVGDPAQWAGPSSGALAVLEAAGWPVHKGLHRFIFSGVFEKHPGLKIVYTEQTAQPSMWWVNALNEYDSVWRKRHWQVGEICPRLPSEYMRNHVWLGASFLHRAPDEPWKAIRGGYDQHVLWGTDYPHAEGVWINEGDESTTRLAFQYIFAGVPERAVRRIAGENAARAYGLDMNALQQTAERINAPTMADLEVAPDPNSIPLYWSGDD